MYEPIIKFIRLIHYLIFFFIILTPFTNNTILLSLHFVIIPFIYIQWLLNNNTCGLTLIEKNLQKKINGKIDEDECFTCKLITPICNFNKNPTGSILNKELNYNKINIFIYISMFLLWTITVYKLYYKCTKYK